MNNYNKEIKLSEIKMFKNKKGAFRSNHIYNTLNSNNSCSFILKTTGDYLSL